MIKKLQLNEANAQHFLTILEIYNKNDETEKEELQDISLVDKPVFLKNSSKVTIPPQVVSPLTKNADKNLNKENDEISKPTKVQRSSISNPKPATSPRLEVTFDLLKEELLDLLEIFTLLDYSVGLENVAEKMKNISNEMQTEKKNCYSIEFEDFDLEVYNYVENFTEKLLEIFVFDHQIGKNYPKIHEILIEICEKDQNFN